MKKIRFAFISITLIATLVSGFMFSFLSDGAISSDVQILHHKSSKELVSQQYFLEENESEIDEKINEVIRPIFFLLATFLFAIILKSLLKKGYLQGFFGLNFRPNMLLPIYLSNQVFRN